MFWNKKVKADGLPITLSIRDRYMKHTLDAWNEEVTLHRYLAYKAGDTWRGLVDYSEYEKKTDVLESKLDLILDHLKLKYVPETKTTEPAKLVKKEDWGSFIGELSDYPIFKDMPVFTKPKKKGRPKKK